MDHQPARVTRAALVRLAAGGAASLALGSGAGTPATASPARAMARDALQPVSAAEAILAKLRDEPLVAICERHMLQEWHDFIGGVLTHPELTRALDAIVVEFGNAAYQAVCDRFIIDGAPVPRADLAQIWRQIGDPTWNAPVYEQFYRTLRAVNRTRPATRRIRILLGQAPIKMSDVVAHPTDHAKARALATPMDDHYATTVQRDVLDHGRRALLIAGKGHLLRDLSTDRANHTPNAITQIIRTTRAKPYVIDNLILPDSTNADVRRAVHELAHQPTTVLAPLAGTWLGATNTITGDGWLNELADRALSPNANRYEHQADALLYLGAGAHLTASQPDPAIYHWGTYPDQLQRAATLAGAGDQIALAIHWATSPPGYFNLFK